LNKKEISVYWFKRDLRLVDNPALSAALKSEHPTLMVYIHEPSVWQNDHYSQRHRHFINESLTDLDETLSEHGIAVLAVESEVIPFFEKLREHAKLTSVYSTEESGLAITYERDLKFHEYCNNHDISWSEYQNNGVVRGLKNRDGWSKTWYAFMNKSIEYIDLNNSNFISRDDFDFIKDGFLLFKKEIYSTNFQRGGRRAALSWQSSFFEERIAYYSDYISKPEQSHYGCSRLSPYFAWGNLSIREVYQKAKAFKAASTYKKQTNAFMSRLRWQSHFIQKFEMECRMEFEAVNKGFLTLEQPINENYVESWKSGTTGYPLVDASINCVKQTGYLNFRMRAMITSFLTHHLFQHFTTGAAWLARQFLDFEPGIHYGQFQMQAGFTGTNTVRVYSPTKNANDHDPDAAYIKKYLPVLASLPTHLALEPWNITPMEEKLYSFNYGTDYPKRIVDIKETRKYALKQLYGHRKNERTKLEKERILRKHTIRRKNK